jgi:hypothetical protein
VLAQRNLQMSQRKNRLVAYHLAHETPICLDYRSPVKGPANYILTPVHKQYTRACWQRALGQLSLEGLSQVRRDAARQRYAEMQHRAFDIEEPSRWADAEVFWNTAKAWLWRGLISCLSHTASAAARNTTTSMLQACSRGWMARQEKVYQGGQSYTAVRKRGLQQGCVFAKEVVEDLIMPACAMEKVAWPKHVRSLAIECYNNEGLNRPWGILGDAMEDALPGHSGARMAADWLRDRAEHYVGCWAADWVLGLA